MFLDVGIMAIIKLYSDIIESDRILFIVSWNLEGISGE